MPGVVAYTIVSRAYVPHARVLATSYLRHHPGGEFWALLIDDLYDEVQEVDEPFHVLRLRDLTMDEAEVHRMAMLFGNRIIAAIKPWIFEHFLALGAQAVIYIDSDFVIYDEIRHVGEAAIDQGVVVVPHVVTPVPHDELLPDETLILGVGTFNAGFFAVGPDSTAFVDFLKERLRRECHTDVRGMRVNEQRWLDFVPALFDHAVVRDRGIDVAPWNLHERRLVRVDGRLYAGGVPLRAFHFSGFDPRVPSVLSARDYWERPRVPMTDEPILIELCDDYRRALFDAGFEKAHRMPFAFDFLPDGRPIYSSLRNLYAAALRRDEAAGCGGPPDPFDPVATEAFSEWTTRAYRDAGLPVPVRLQNAGAAGAPAEDWLGRMIAVGAGNRRPEGTVQLDPEISDFVTVGPYAQLSAGCYRVVVEVRFRPELLTPTDLANPLSLDVVLDGYVLACATADPRDVEPVVMNFTVSDRLEQSSLSAGVEVRVFSPGGVHAAIDGVLVERLGDAPMDQSGVLDRFEWLPAMVPGDAGVRKGPSIVQLPNQLGFVALGPHWRFESGRYRAELRLRSGTAATVGADDVLGLVEAIVNNHVLASRAVDRRSVAQGPVAIDFDFGTPWVGLRTARVELRLRAGAESALALDGVSVKRIGDAGALAEPEKAAEWIPAMWVSDIGTRHGSEIHATSTHSGILAYGPHWRLGGGRYRAVVLVGAEDSTEGTDASSPAASIEAVVDGQVTAERTVTSGTLAGTDDDAQEGANVLEFEVVASGHAGQDVEVRVVTTGRRRIAVRSVVIGPVDAP